MHQVIHQCHLLGIISQSLLALLFWTRFFSCWVHFRECGEGTIHHHLGVCIILLSWSQSPRSHIFLQLDIFACFYGALLLVDVCKNNGCLKMTKLLPSRFDWMCKTTLEIQFSVCICKHCWSVYWRYNFHWGIQNYPFYFLSRGFKFFLPSISSVLKFPSDVPPCSSIIIYCDGLSVYLPIWRPLSLRKSEGQFGNKFPCCCGLLVVCVFGVRSLDL